MPLNTTIALATVEAVELALGLECNVYALRIEQMINYYSAMLEALTGRKLKARNYTNYRLDGKGGRDIWFPEYPVNTVTALAIYDINNVLYHTVPINDLSKFTIHNAIGRLHLIEEVYLKGEQNIVFTGNAGITDTTELLMLEMAIIELISANDPSSTWSSSSVRSERLGSYSVSYGTTGFASTSVQNVLSYFARVA